MKKHPEMVEIQQSQNTGGIGLTNHELLPSSTWTISIQFSAPQSTAVCYQPYHLLKFKGTLGIDIGIPFGICICALIAVLLRSLSTAVSFGT